MQSSTGHSLYGSWGLELSGKIRSDIFFFFLYMLSWAYPSRRFRRLAICASTLSPCIHVFRFLWGRIPPRRPHHFVYGNDSNTAGRTIVRSHGRFHPASKFNPTTEGPARTSGIRPGWSHVLEGRRVWRNLFKTSGHVTVHFLQPPLSRVRVNSRNAIEIFANPLNGIEGIFFIYDTWCQWQSRDWLKF